MVCFGVVSPGCWICRDLWSWLLALPLPNWRVGQGVVSSSGKLTPLSFQGLRSALKLLVDSMEIKEDLETLFEPFLKNDPAGDWELFLRRSRNEEMEDMLPGLRSLSKIVLRSRATSSPKADLVGESVETGAGACWRSFESKN